MPGRKSDDDAKQKPVVRRSSDRDDSPVVRRKPEKDALPDRKSARFSREFLAEERQDAAPADRAEGAAAFGALRLNRALAQTGYCSRRKADQLIADGKVRVNNVVVKDFNREIDPQRDSLSVEGTRLSFKKHVYIALHKPAGVVTTMSDEQGRKTVMDLLPPNLRHLRPVGRLDMYSEGLLLLTNDGDLCQTLTHPVHQKTKLYRITVRGKVANNDLTKLAQGIYLEDGLTLPAKVRLITRDQSSSEFEMTLVEGRNRQIRRMCAALGLPIIRLVRLGIGRLQLGLTGPGKWRYLTDVEVKLLFS